MTKAEPVAGAVPTILSPQTSSPVCERCSWCAEGPGRGRLIGGAGLYLLQPYFDNNVAFAFQATLNRSTGAIPPGSPGTRTDVRVGINQHMEAAPEIWLGYVSDCGLGGRLRYWYFREGTSQSVRAPENQGVNNFFLYSAAPLGLSLVDPNSMTVTSKLEFQVTDAEALYDLEACRWNLLFAGGVRLAWIDQAYNAFVEVPGRSTVLSSHTFQGVGPTLALEARHALGATGVSLYGNTRGSLIFGSAHQIATQVGQNVEAQERWEVGTAVGEIELGVEYGRGFGRSRFFGQLAFVGQEWFGVGGASRSSVAALPGAMINNQAPYVGDSDVALLGLVIRLGLSY
jgi:hypothetical protein